MNKFNRLFAIGASIIILATALVVTGTAFAVFKPQSTKVILEVDSIQHDTIRIETKVIIHDTLRIPASCKKNHCDVVVTNTISSTPDTIKKQID
ncbi:hypothetical protein UFOVP1604_62 [uncultured Caudovirales phage]|uniref:Uncharacterized protein n=1 Tax=uncultured Caudovirales phage TaxID=2100421 RepID=A0A6J5SUH3_9CAUD|nr:hypothetical protein UFOVP1604_62 [uncultured Caudovirales phage]